MKKFRELPLSVTITMLCVVAGIVLFPLFRPGFIVSDDGDWMIIRLSAFFQNLADGQFPVRFLGRLNQSYGYPVANFLYPGFLYVGSLIHLLGFSFVDSIKLVLVGSVAGAAVFIYAWLRRHFSSYGSLLGALSFLGAPYLLFDMYTRGSVGEVYALCWAAMGMYSIGAKKPWLFALAIALLITGHNTIAMLSIGLFVLYLLKIQAIREYFYPLLLGFGMSAFFWFPALYERQYVLFDSIRISEPKGYFISPGSLHLVGFVFLTALVVSFFIQKKEKFKSFVTGAFIVSTLLATSVSAVIWNQNFFAKLIQFPYRWLSLGLLLGPWIVAYVIDGMKHTPKRVFIATIAVLWLAGTLNTITRIRYKIEPEGYYTTNEATTTVHDEYMPRWVLSPPKERSSERLIFYNGKGTITPNTQSTQYFDMRIEALEDSVIQINTIYYPGWGVSLNDRPVEIDYHNPEGLMRVNVPKGNHRLLAAFRETVPRFMADLVAVVSGILFLLYWIAVAKKTK